MGAGPMTGRGMGYCRPAGGSFFGNWWPSWRRPWYGAVPGGYSRFGFGRFGGFGRGRGAGRRGGWWW
jgi:hypothetical protein